MNKSHYIVYWEPAANCIFGKESRKHSRGPQQASGEKQCFHLSSRCTSLDCIVKSQGKLRAPACSFSYQFQEPPFIERPATQARSWTIGHICLTAGPLNASFLCSIPFARFFCHLDSSRRQGF